MSYARAVHPAATRSYRDPSDIHPVLPERMQRDSFVVLVERVAPSLGVGRAAARAFVRLASLTRPSDWILQDRSPVIYAEAGEVAKILGVSQPRLRAITVELELAGLIERRTGANGSRSRSAGTGLFLSAAIARADELMALDAQLTAERQQAKYLRGQRSTHRRHLVRALDHLCEMAADHPRIAEIRFALAQWPSADQLHIMPIGSLADHVEDADNLCRSTLDLVEKVEESIGGPLENKRRYLQDTTEESPGTCNARVDQRRAGKPAHGNLSAGPPDGGTDCCEKDARAVSGAFKSEFIAKLGPERLFRLASPDMQFYLSGRAEPQHLRFHDFVWAAERRVPELGISPDAWNAAKEVMGDDSAMLSVFILDARKAEPGNAIFKPGGYLRGMTEKYRKGDLHLIRSLIGLSERKRGDGAS